MCGICGIVDFSDSSVSAEALDKMVASLLHRGRDDHGTYIRSHVTLAHTRLSILDLSPLGHQPMGSEDGAVWVTYNGEVYNFQDLRRELEAPGRPFKSNCDTEVIIRGFERWGLDVLPRLNGMFAAGIWDSRREELHLARDMFGIKPLYFALTPHGLVFGSEIKALFASGAISPVLSTDPLTEFLYYGNALGGRTLFHGIQQVLPGEIVTVSRAGLQRRFYWQPEKVPQRTVGVDEATEQVRELLAAAVRRHLVSDVPVGVFLSGGIDSSAIAAFASREVPRIQTYSAGFDFSGSNSELPQAASVAKAFGTDHHEFMVHVDSLAEIIEALIAAHDHPFSDAANIPLYLLTRALNGAPKVVLQGDGGDEIFGGYRRYAYLGSPARLAAARVGAGLARWLAPASLRHGGPWRFLQATGEADPGRRMALLLTVETESDPPTQVLSAEWRRRVAGQDPFARYRAMARRFQCLDPVQQMLYTDTQIILPDIFLEKVDRSTMAHTTEVRVPFLDRDLATYTMGLPASVKLPGGQQKWLLKRALRGVVPDSVLDAPKRGFGVPYGNWLRGPLLPFLRSVLFDPSVSGLGLFDRAELERRIEQHAGRRADHGFLLWKCLMLALWLRRYNPSVSAP